MALGGEIEIAAVRKSTSRRACTKFLSIWKEKIKETKSKYLFVFVVVKIQCSLSLVLLCILNE